MSKSETVLAAFSIDHVAQVTRISKARLARWDKFGFFSPGYLDEDDKGNPYSRVYSFTDLVGLRTLKVLVDDYHVSRDELAKAARELESRSDKPWSEIPLAVVKRKVVFDLDTLPHDTDGQQVMKYIPLDSIASEVAKRAAELRKRNNDQIGVIERHKFIAHNSRVMAGTRVPVKAIESFIEDDYTNEQIVEEYPSLTAFDVAIVREQMKEV